MKQMKRLSIIWGALLISIVILLTVFGIIYNKKNKIYTDMENDLENATKKYIEKSFAYPKDNKELRVEYSDLKESNLIKELKVDGEKCNGYVIVKNNSMVYEYKGYVKCPEYKTKNYQN